MKLVADNESEEPAPWITTSFIPSTMPMVTHYLERPDDTALITELVAGWLIQHKYGDPDNTVPTDSRVIAGSISSGGGVVWPVLIDSRQYVGIYPAGVTPPEEDVEETRRDWPSKN